MGPQGALFQGSVIAVWRWSRGEGSVRGGGEITNTIWLSDDDQFDPQSDVFLERKAVGDFFDVAWGSHPHSQFFDLSVQLPSEQDILAAFGQASLSSKYYLFVVAGYYHDGTNGDWYAGELYRDNNIKYAEIQITGSGFSADAGPDQNVTLPSGQSTVLVTLDGSGSNPISAIDEFRWMLEGTVIGQGMDISYAFGAGAHRVRLEVIDYGNLPNDPSDDRSAEDDVQTLVSSPPNPPPGNNEGNGTTSPGTSHEWIGLLWYSLRY